MIKSKLGIGPMSSEIIEAVYRYSHYYRTPLMLIPSKNQIDHSGGYVNGWTTKDFASYIDQMRALYDFSDVLLCRDHCGPGFNGNYDLRDTYQTINADLESGFDLIHIDFCHYQGSYEESLLKSKEVIEYILKKNSKLFLEIGTDENTGANFALSDLKTIENELDWFLEFCLPEFFVVQTGSLVKESLQVGNFNRGFIQAASEILRAKKIKLKEHNADYLESSQISERYGLVDAMNIAPQLGVLQTRLVIEKCREYKIDYREYLNLVYTSQKWSKWVLQDPVQDKNLCLEVAGHYHFNSTPYRKILDQLSLFEDIRELIINQAMETVEHYERNYAREPLNQAPENRS